MFALEDVRRFSCFLLCCFAFWTLLLLYLCVCVLCRRFLGGGVNIHSGSITVCYWNC